MSLTATEGKYHFPALNELSGRIRECIEDHGFSKPNNSNVAEKLMLTVTELSEALEFARDGNFDLFFDGLKPDGFPAELADAIIRILDMCAAMNIDIAKVLALKMGYNESRPVRHGRQF